MHSRTPTLGADFSVSCGAHLAVLGAANDLLLDKVVQQLEAALAANELGLQQHLVVTQGAAPAERPQTLDLGPGLVVPGGGGGRGRCP